MNRTRKQLKHLSKNSMMEERKACQHRGNTTERQAHLINKSIRAMCMRTSPRRRIKFWSKWLSEVSKDNRMPVSHNESRPIYHHIKSHQLSSKQISKTMKHLINDILPMVEKPSRSRIDEKHLSITEDMKTRKTSQWELKHSNKR